MPIRLRLAAVAAAIILALPIRDPVDAQTIAVRGVAYDSLRGIPLRNAVVTVAGTAGRTTTDELGQFAIDGVAPGVRTFHAQHPALDSLGLSGISARTTVTDGRELVRLGVPSFVTLWRNACGATPMARDRGFIYGTVRDAISLDPVPSAIVDLAWLDLQASKELGVSQRRWRGQARTDSTGSYSICGIPTADGLRMQALSDSAASGIVNVFGSALRIQRRDLLIGRVNDSVLTRRATIIGRVTDSAGVPFRDARIFVDEYGEVRSGVDGTVLMRSVPAGTRQIDVMAVGRLPVTVIMDLAAGDTGVFSAALHKITTLDVVRVTGTRRQRRMIEDFESRRRNSSGFVLDSTDLAQRASLSSAFEGLPSLEVRSRSGQLSLTLPGSGGGRCVPVVFIDGRKADLDQLNMLRIGELAAVELYPRRMSAPAAFLTNDLCGSIVVWTRWVFG
jgi:hypothetical protein